MSEWISVKERLPDTESNVLVRTKKIPGLCSAETMMAWKRADEDESWQIAWTYGESLSLPVTHWMPLPAPPKEAPNE